jgi:hypothetical protein
MYFNIAGIKEMSMDWISQACPRLDKRKVRGHSLFSPSASSCPP